MTADNTLAALYANLSQIESKIDDATKERHDIFVKLTAANSLLDGYKSQRTEINAKIREAKRRKKPNDGVPEFLKRAPAA
jgi:chromosome segregation ATPase